MLIKQHIFFNISWFVKKRHQIKNDILVYEGFFLHFHDLVLHLHKILNDNNILVKITK